MSKDNIFLEKDYKCPLAQKQSLSIDQWYRYAEAGVNIPVKTLLSGSSMEPLIRYKKDIVTVIPLKRKLMPGDIVLLKRKDGAFVVHRCRCLLNDETAVQTWGDNCERPDEPIDIDSVLGLIVCMEKDGRQIMLDTDEQREYGIRWMDGSAKRKIWFLKKQIKGKIRGVAVKRFGFLLKNNK